MLRMNRREAEPMLRVNRNRQSEAKPMLRVNRREAEPMLRMNRNR